MSFMESKDRDELEARTGLLAVLCFCSSLCMRPSYLPLKSGFSRLSGRALSAPELMGVHASLSEGDPSLSTHPMLNLGGRNSYRPSLG